MDTYKPKKMGFWKKALLTTTILATLLNPFKNLYAQDTDSDPVNTKDIVQEDDNQDNDSDKDLSEMINESQNVDTGGIAKAEATFAENVSGVDVYGNYNWCINRDAGIGGKVFGRAANLSQDRSEFDLDTLKTSVLEYGAGIYQPLTFNEGAFDLYWGANLKNQDISRSGEFASDSEILFLEPSLKGVFNFDNGNQLKLFADYAFNLGDGSYESEAGDGDIETATNQFYELKFCANDVLDGDSGLYFLVDRQLSRREYDTGAESTDSKTAFAVGLTDYIDWFGRNSDVSFGYILNQDYADQLGMQWIQQVPGKDLFWTFTMAVPFYKRDDEGDGPGFQLQGGLVGTF